MQIIKIIVDIAITTSLFLYCKVLRQKIAIIFAGMSLLILHLMQNKNFETIYLSASSLRFVLGIIVVFSLIIGFSGEFLNYSKSTRKNIKPPV